MVEFDDLAAATTFFSEPGLLGVVSEPADRLEQAFAALDRGDVSGFGELFTKEAQWLGVPGSGFDGATST